MTKEHDLDARAAIIEFYNLSSDFNSGCDINGKIDETIQNMEIIAELNKIPPMDADIEWDDTEGMIRHIDALSTSSSTLSEEAEYGVSKKHKKKRKDVELGDEDTDDDEPETFDDKIDEVTVSRGFYEFQSFIYDVGLQTTWKRVYNALVENNMTKINRLWFDNDAHYHAGCAVMLESHSEALAIERNIELILEDAREKVGENMAKFLKFIHISCEVTAKDKYVTFTPQNASMPKRTIKYDGDVFILHTYFFLCHLRRILRNQIRHFIRTLRDDEQLQRPAGGFPEDIDPVLMLDYNFKYVQICKALNQSDLLKLFYERLMVCVKYLVTHCHVVNLFQEYDDVLSTRTPPGSCV